MAVTGNNSKRVRRGTGADPRIQAVVEQLVRGGQTSAAEVHRSLVENFGEANVPSVRTVQNMVKESRDLGPKEQWSLISAEPDEIPLIVPVWVAALEWGYCIDNADVARIVRIRTVAPDLSPDDVLALNAFYSMEDHVGRRRWRDDLDALLAFAPWRGLDRTERYFKAANSGRIVVPPLKLSTKAITEEVAAADVPEAIAYMKRHPDDNSFTIKDGLVIIDAADR